jgi:glycosyltransferase involved in cell wall biosynthesis
MSDGPLVSVVTPVYNGEAYLAECIESILNQAYQNFEYLIVNNCSEDRTLEIAMEYSKKDSRIRVHNNAEFVGVIANHNLAFSLISREAKYCKVVSADDFIFPECLIRMVELAEANPAVGIIASYQLSGDHILWQGFKYPKAVFSGREICRQIFLGNDETFGFGSPTSLMYRANLVRSSEAFYPNSSPHADTSACFNHLQNSSFGFVYQVLSYERTHEATQSTKSKELNRYSSAYINDLILYGPSYLDKREFDRQLDKQLKSYHRFLGISYFMRSRDKEFWDYHKARFQELGYPLSRLAILKAAVVAALQEVLNPEQAVRKLWKRLFPDSQPNARSGRSSSGSQEISSRKSNNAVALVSTCESQEAIEVHANGGTIDRKSR